MGFVESPKFGRLLEFLNVDKSLEFGYHKDMKLTKEKEVLASLNTELEHSRKPRVSVVKCPSSYIVGVERSDGAITVNAETDEEGEALELAIEEARVLLSRWQHNE